MPASSSVRRALARSGPLPKAKLRVIQLPSAPGAGRRRAGHVKVADLARKVKGEDRAALPFASAQSKPPLRRGRASSRNGQRRAKVARLPALLEPGDDNGRCQNG